ATFPESHFSSNRFNKELFAAIAARDIGVAKEKLADALRIFATQSGELIPAHGNRVFVAKKNVQGMRFRHTQGVIMDFRRAYRSSWPKGSERTLRTDVGR